MILIDSPSAVGLRVARRLVGRTGILLTAPRSRIGEARAAVAALLDRDTGSRVDVQPDDLIVRLITDAGTDRIEEIWYLSDATGGEREVHAALLAGLARETGAAFRRFDLDLVAEAPGEIVPGAFSALMQAMNVTVQEVRSRDAMFFEQRALRTTLPADLPILDAGSAASEVVSAAAGPPGRCRIAAANEGPTMLSEAIGEAYELELIMGAAPSELAAVDRLFESRLGSIAETESTVPIHRARPVGSSELASLVSQWHQHHAAAARAERERLDDLSAAAAVPSAGGREPAIQVFGRSGPVIVIVNAIAQDLLYWMRLVDRLAGEYQVVTWAQRSLTEDGQPTTFDDQLRDLETVVCRVTDGPVHLLGWCTGPKLCVRYCLAHPDRVASMVFLAGGYRPFGDNSLDTSYEITLEMVFKLLDQSPNAAPTVRTTVLDAICGGESKEASVTDLGEEALARIDSALLPSLAAPYATDESTLVYAKQVRDFWSRSIESDVGGIDARVLVIGAELDRIVSSRLGQRVAEALPNASYIELPGATHYCMYDRPDEVAATLDRFIGEQDPHSTFVGAHR